MRRSTHRTLSFDSSTLGDARHVEVLQWGPVLQEVEVGRLLFSWFLLLVPWFMRCGKDKEDDEWCRQ